MSWTYDLSRTMTELLRTNRPFASVVVVETSGSAPQKTGARLLVLDDGSIQGTIGGGRFEWEVMRVAREALAEGTPRFVRYDLAKDLGMACGGAMSAFIEPHLPAERVLVYGAGHCARALVPHLLRAGFRVRVVDPRSDLLETSEFDSSVDLVESDTAADAAQAIRAEDWVLIMTHGHTHDLYTLRAALPHAPRYLGVMASKRKAENFRRTLLDEGFSEEQVSSVSMPIGMDIGAVGPEEIAVSVAAQIISIRRAGGDV
ncbi:MAG: XdhC family protein [Pseudomonadota bacterium]